MKKIKNWIKDSVRSLEPYHVPGADGMIKMDAMENPYTWPDNLRAEWLAVLKDVNVNRYPDPHCVLLKQKLRKVMNIPDDMAVMIGNGSDELIQIIVTVMAQPDRVILTPEPGFVMYRNISTILETQFIGVQLSEKDFALDQKEILSAIEQHQPALIFIAWPNNPTGNLFDESLVDTVIQAAPGLVVLDEAYHAFSHKSYIGRLHEFNNLLVVRTLSKSGLAGLRLGYVAGSKEWLDELEKVRLPYNINILTQKSAEFILSHYKFLETQAELICKSRDELFEHMSDFNNFQVWPSAANFILFRDKNLSAGEVYNGLKHEGVLIKNLHGSHPLLDQCLRVTVGTNEENQSFLCALKNLN